jgi:hypothetical protein
MTKNTGDDETATEDDPEVTEGSGPRPYTLMDVINDVEAPANGEAVDVLASLRRSIATLVGSRSPTSARQAESLDLARSYKDLVRNRPRSRLDVRRGPLKRGPRKIDEVPVSAIIVGEKIQNARIRRDEEQHQALRSSVAEDGIDIPVGLVEDDLRPGKFHLIWGEGRLDVA